MCKAVVGLGAVTDGVQIAHRFFDAYENRLKIEFALATPSHAGKTGKQVFENPRRRQNWCPCRSLRRQQ